MPITWTPWIRFSQPVHRPLELHYFSDVFFGADDGVMVTNNARYIGL